MGVRNVFTQKAASLISTNLGITLPLTVVPVASPGNSIIGVSAQPSTIQAFGALYGVILDGYKNLNLSLTCTINIADTWLVYLIPFCEDGYFQPNLAVPSVSLVGATATAQSCMISVQRNLTTGVVSAIAVGTQQNNRVSIFSKGVGLFFLRTAGAGGNLSLTAINLELGS